MIQPVSSPRADTADQAQLREAGAAFEALILQQLLGGILPEGGGAGGAGALAIQALARDLAEASPFGVARLLEARQ